MLWIWYCPGTDAQIQAACAIASEELARRGYLPDVAQRAAFDALEHDDGGADQTANADAVVAWYFAEEAAFQSIHAATGEWPQNATLVITGGEEHGS